MTEKSVRPLSVRVRYTVGVKAEIDDVACDDWQDEGAWVVFYESGGEVKRYNRNAVVTMTVKVKFLEAKLVVE